MSRPVIRLTTSLVLVWIVLSSSCWAFSSPVMPQSPAKPHDTSAPLSVPHDASPHLVFPGGGIFFYWQAGAVTYLREAGYNLTSATFTGASAGALTATLASTDVDYAEATTLALDLCKKAGVWDRSKGLQGIWGPMIEEWLDQLLPEDAVDRTDNRLSLLLTPIPALGKTRVDSFQDRKDLIRCNMASIHLPWFLDGKLTTNFRQGPYIDGSFLASSNDYKNPRNPANTLVLDYKMDPVYAKKGILEFVEAISPDGIWRILDDGKRFAMHLDNEGAFELFPKNQS